jgi:peptidoglycan/LPS O-acetylase OafA/YrhL
MASGTDDPGGSGGPAQASAEPAQETARSDHEADDGLGTRGTVLLATLLLALLVVPVLIYWRPPQLPFLLAFLVLPLVPAFALGIVAVWSLTESEPRRPFEE